MATGTLKVCDAGMPIPDGPRVVDLAFRAGVPSLAEVLEGLVLEGATAAEEVRGTNPGAVCSSEAPASEALKPPTP